MHVPAFLLSIATLAASATASHHHAGISHPLYRRQSATVSTDSSTDPMAPLTLVENPPQNVTAWDEATDAACISALAKLGEATNPSGTCVCYNLPALDTNTGVFQADLRLYKISEARDQFSGIAPENIQVGLAYKGASVSQAGTATGSAGASEGSAAAKVRRNGDGLSLVKRVDPQLLQTYTFVGQIDQEQMELNNPMTMAAVEALVMPVVTLSSTANGQVVSTNVSMNEAAFVVGVFSDEVVLSDTARAQLEVDRLQEGLKNGTVVFQVPGIRIMIFPVGLIITSLWLAIFLSVVGYGTFQRMNYREQFRRRTAQMKKGGMGTI